MFFKQCGATWVSYQLLMFFLSYLIRFSVASFADTSRFDVFEKKGRFLKWCRWSGCTIKIQQVLHMWQIQWPCPCQINIELCVFLSRSSSHQTKKKHRRAGKAVPALKSSNKIQSTCREITQLWGSSLLRLLSAQPQAPLSGLRPLIFSLWRCVA